MLNSAFSTRFACYALTTFLVALAGCRDSAIPSASPAVRMTYLPRPIPDVVGPTIVNRDRKDTPFSRMSDAELADAVTKARGRVVIGFREPGARDGVNARGEVLVSSERVSAAKISLRASGVAPVYECRKIPAVVATIDARQVAELRSQPWVDYLEPEVTGEYLSQEVPHGLVQTGITSAWSLSTGSGVKVLILDSGTPKGGHRDLYFPVSFRCGSGPVEDSTDYGHGTLVAGIVGAANNSVDVVGAAYDADIWMANVTAYPVIAPSASEMACAIDVGRANGVFVVNMSVSLGSQLTSLTDEINGGYNTDGMLFVAAVGNDGASTVSYPASLASVIGVTSIDSLNAHPSGANTGPEVELSARGINILTTSFSSAYQCAGAYVVLCGLTPATSLAAPYVTGAIALMKARYPSWSNIDIRARLRNKANDLGSTGFDNTFGYGRLDSASAIGMTTGVDGSGIGYVGQEGQWGAIFDGGQSPHATQWWIDGVPAGTDQVLAFTPSAEGSVLLTVRVTDYFGLIAWSSRSITIVDCGNPCS